ncbi:unnamed protein product [Brassica oleracea]|uniref:(rape) hypothetical protein n=1 Tax=Brassica napus TaxID=3708 RepID=A0A816IQN9_BRANA|nr:unnamed protein product [Brassica napus]
MKNTIHIREYILIRHTFHWPLNIYEYDVWLRKFSKLRYIQDKANLFKTYYISKIKQQ